MTTYNHTDIEFNADADTAVVNAPLGQLDAAIGNVAALTTTADSDTVVAINEVDANIGDLSLLGTTTKNSIVSAIGSAALRTTYTAKLIPAINELLDRVVAAQAEIDALEAQVAGLVVAGGNIATLTNGAASAGQKVVTVDSSTGFLDTANVVYTLATGIIEYNQIDAIGSPTQITLTTNIGTGGIANDTYFAMISPSEKAAAQKVNVGNGVSQTLDVAMNAALGNVYDAEAYGASSSASAATNTAAIQAALDAMDPAVGGTLFLSDIYPVTQIVIPNGEAVAARAKAHYIIRGNGVSSGLISATASPIFVWAENDVNAKTSFYDISATNTVGGGSIMQWASTDYDAYRLALHVENCVFEYFGALVSHGNIAAIDFDGLIASSFINVQIRGGSPVGGGAYIGWGMHLKGSSTCHFDQLYFCGGNSGRGLWLEEGGNHIFSGMRIDNGSRYGGPAYFLDNTQSNTFIQMRGEGAESDPFLLIKNSHSLTFIDASLPEIPYAVNANIIEIENSHHIQFVSGRSGSQHAQGGTGKSIAIDVNSNYVRFQDFNICTVGSAVDDVSNLSTGFVQLDLLDGNAFSSFRNPPSGVRYIGRDHHGTISVGENGTDIDLILHATAGWNPGSLADGATESTTVTVPNAGPTDTIIGLSMTSCGSANWTLRAHLYDDSGTTKAKVWLTNNTGGTVDLASGTVTVVVGRFPYTHI